MASAAGCERIAHAESIVFITPGHAPGFCYWADGGDRNNQTFTFVNCPMIQPSTTQHDKGNEMANAYGIKNKATGLLFAGFDAAGNAKWSDKGASMSKDAATAQAILLAKFDRAVQRKPVAL